MPLSSYFKSITFAISVAASPLILAEAEVKPKSKPIELNAEQQKSLELLTLNAAREGDAKTISSYLESGLSPNILSKRGDSLLILASYYGHTEVVEVLLKNKKTEVNLVNKMGFSALTGAAFRGRDTIVETLIKHGAEVDQVNNKGQSALMFAAMFGQEGVVAVLIEHGVDVELRTPEGKTAGDLARAQGRENMPAIIADAVTKKKNIDAVRAH